jgi:hypothetical protein
MSHPSSHAEPSAAVSGLSLFLASSRQRMLAASAVLVVLWALVWWALA